MAEQEERDPLEVLTGEFAARQRNGEALDMEEFIAAHPAQAADLRELLPLVAAMEQTKREQARTELGRAALGGPRPGRLGEFAITRELGRGGMGIVYEARQESLDRRVALKVLPRSVLLDRTALDRFQREARAIARLNHPNIISVFSVGEQDGLHYFAMQYVEGVSWDRLAQRLAQRPADCNRPLAETVRAMLGSGGTAQPPAPAEPYARRVAALARDAARALQHAHASNLLHRDVKPANLLLDVDGRVYVSDFGLAKALLGSDASLTREGGGTLRYMAPEQLDGQADARSDVYGLGLTLYGMLALRPPFSAETQAALMRQVLAGELGPLPAERNVPAELQRIVCHAAALRPEERYPSAAACADDLDRYLRGEPLAARSRSWLSGTRARVAAAAIVLALAGSAAFLALRGKGAENAGATPAAAEKLPPPPSDALPPPGGLPPPKRPLSPEAKRLLRGDGPLPEPKLPPRRDGVRPDQKRPALPRPGEEGVPHVPPPPGGELPPPPAKDGIPRNRP